jgi:hypothetical protein
MQCAAVEVAGGRLAGCRNDQDRAANKPGTRENPLAHRFFRLAGGISIS